MNFAEPHSFSTPTAIPDDANDDAPALELDPTSDYNENDADVPAIAVEKGNLDDDDCFCYFQK